MQGRFIALLEDIRGGFWFVPAVMTLIAVLLSIFTIVVDQRGTPEWLLQLRFIFLNQPGGARSLLSTIAGSLISVAGVVFSLTIVALTLASQQFGPRLLGNFMRDRGNQVVLGTFVATFLYSLLILRTVRGEGDGRDSFVPHLSVTVALLLAVVTLAATIYFIHHIASSIQVDNVIGKVAGSIERHIRGSKEHDLFPSRIGVPLDDPDSLPDGFESLAKPVRSAKAGYLQAVDGEGVLRMATRHGAVIRLRHRPGVFLLQGQIIADVYPGSEKRVIEEELSKHLTFGVGRNQTQDVESLFDQLLELSLRALAPSTNDPFTAISCINRIATSLLALDRRELPSSLRANHEGELRLIVPPFDYAALADRAFSSIRADVARNLLTSQRVLAILDGLRQELPRGPGDDHSWNNGTRAELDRVLRRQHQLLLESCRELLSRTDYGEISKLASG